MSPRGRRNLLTILVFLVNVLLTRSTCPNLQEQLNSIDSLIRLAHEKVEVLVGSGVGIVADGQIVFAKGYGLRNNSETQSHVTNRTIFAIGSCSKAFTAYTVDRLREDGVLDWSDLVVEHIPEFRVKDNCATTNMQIKDLASHVTGLPRHDTVWDSTNFPREELLRRIPHLEPSYGFRERYQYNNIMIAVEGIVVERVSNRSWENVVHERILKPLHMERTYPQIREAWEKQVDDIAAGHSLEGTSVKSVPFLEITNVAPCGAVVSSAEDMSKWVQMQLQLSGRSTEMHDVQAPIPADDPTRSGAIGYGFGWFVGYRNGRKVVFDGGRIRGFVAYVTLFPEAKLGVVSMANTGTRPILDFIQNLNLKIADILTYCNSTEADIKEWVETQAKVAAEKQASLEWESGPREKPEVEKPDQYVGSFVNDGYGVFHVSHDGQRLTAFFNVNFSVQPTKVRDFFYFSGTQGQFERNILGDVTGLYLDFEEAVSPILFKKAVPSELYAIEYLESFVGGFGDITISIHKHKKSIVANGSVSVSVKLDGVELTPLKRNWFEDDNLFFEFKVVNGTVQELILHSGDSYKSYHQDK